LPSAMNETDPSLTITPRLSSSWNSLVESSASSSIRSRKKFECGSPTTFDHHIAAFNIAGLVEPLVVGCDETGERICRRRMQEADDWHCRLLRACRERPRGGCAAEQCDEIAPPHGGPCLSAGTTRYQIKAVLCTTANSERGRPDWVDAVEKGLVIVGSLGNL